MAFQVGAFCYDTAEGAANAAASSQVGSVVSVGGVSYVVDVSSVSPSSITYLFSDVSTASSFIKVAPFSAPDCGLLGASDGLVLGWGIATVWLVTAGVLFLRKGIHT